MNNSEFFAALAQIADQFVWTNQDGAIRGKAGSTALYCPLTALCYATTGKAYGTGLYHMAAGTLDLDPWVANDLAFAADHVYLTGDPRLAALRILLLTALNLKEVPYANEDYRPVQEEEAPRALDESPSVHGTPGSDDHTD